jgi:hypothetical protein
MTPPQDLKQRSLLRYRNMRARQIRMPVMTPRKTRADSGTEEKEQIL